MTSAVTNSSGQASTILTLGNKVGSYTVTAALAGLSGSPITFVATATGGTPATLILASGNNQVATVMSALPEPLVVTVTDGEGNPAPGVGVTFAIASTPAGATGQKLSVTNASTDADGQASTALTLGDRK